MNNMKKDFYKGLISKGWEPSSLLAGSRTSCRIDSSSGSSSLSSKGGYFIIIWSLLALSLISGSVTAQQGFLNFHLKGLNEAGPNSGAPHRFTLSGPSFPNGTIITLDDKDIQNSIVDIGVSQNGRLWAVTHDGYLYYRDTNNPGWFLLSYASNVWRVDGGKDGDAWFVNYAGDVWHFSSSASSFTRYYLYIQNTNWKAIDIAYAYNYGSSNISGAVALRENGRVWTLNGVNDWSEHSFGNTEGGSFKNIDCTPGGSIFAANGSRVYQSYSSGSSVYYGNPSNSINDITVAGDLGQIFVAGSSSEGVRRFNSGTTWDAWEKEAYMVSRITGGLARQVWGIYRAGSTAGLGNIFSRAVNGQTGEIEWIDDERVRPVEGTSGGNTYFLKLTPGVYTITQTPAVSGWESQKITVYNPTSAANTTNLPGKTATVTVVADQSVNVVWQVGYINPFSMTNSCSTKYLETFGTGAAGSYAQTVAGQTSYHYGSEPGSLVDGQYRLITRGSDFGGYANNIIADHTADEGGATGYMYAVNASFEKGEFFRRRFTGLIIGARYKFGAWVASASNSSIKPNVAFKVYDAVSKNLLQENSTGNITNPFVWRDYGLEFVATSTQIDLVLENNNIGGDGNDLVLDDISFEMLPPPAITGTATGVTCAGTTGSYTVTAPLGSTIQYALNGGDWQTSPTFSSVAPGNNTVKARYAGTTNCETTATINIPVSICGNVYLDKNGLTDNTVNGTGTGTASGTQATLNQLTVNLFLSSGGWYQSTDVRPDGSYTLVDVPVGSYVAAVSNFTGSGGILLSQDLTNRLPVNYVNTGENLGSGAGNDGTLDGKLPIAITVDPASRNNVNFGIKQMPVAGSGVNTRPNVVGVNQIEVPANTFTNTTVSSDPTTGGTIKSITITSLPTGARTIVLNGVTYGTGATAFPSGGVNVLTDGTGQPLSPITVDPIADNATSVSISFVSVDEANLKSPVSGNAVLNLTEPCPNSTISNATPIAICSGQSITLNAAGCGTGYTYKWSTDATTASITVAPTTTTTYTVVCIKAGADACESAIPASVIVTVNNLSSATASASNATCNGPTVNADGRITLSAFGTSDRYAYNEGSTYTGSATYATATDIPSGGVIVSNLPNPASAQTYTVRIFTASGCTIDRTVTLSVTNCSCPTVAAPSLTDGNRCGTGTVSGTITTACASGSTLKIFSDSGLNTDVTSQFSISGTGLTIPSLTATTTYYAACVNNTYPTCKSTGDAVVYTINSEPTATATATRATCAGPTVNSDGRITIAGFMATDKYDYTAGTSYTGSATYANASTIPTGGVIVSNLVNPSSSQPYTVRIFGQNGCYVDRTVTLDVQTCACPNVAQPVVTASSRCGEGTLTSTITTGCTAGNTLKIFSNIGLTADVTSNFTISGNTITSPNITNTVTYFAACVNDLYPTCKSVPDALTLSVNAVPTASATATKATCNGPTVNSDGTITIVGFGTSDRYAYIVGSTYTGTATYATATPIPSGGVVASNLANPSSAQNYTVRIFSSSGCYVDRTVTLSVTDCACPVVAAPVVADANRCGAGNVSTTISTACSSGSTFRIFSNSGLTTDVTGDFTISGNTITRSNLTATTTYYAACVNNTFPACKSSGDDFVLTINPAPPASITVNSPTIYAGQTASLTVTGCTGGTVTWTGGLTSGATTTTPVLSTTTTYTATCSLGSCTGPSAIATVTVMPPTFNPDHNVTHVNVPVTGNLQTNDKNVVPGSTYNTPVPLTGNPSTCVPTMTPASNNTTGAYSFTCATPGVYKFNVPVCEPSPSTVCTNVPLTINVLDKNSPENNAPVAVADIATTPLNTAVTLPTLANDKPGNNGASLVPNTVTVTSSPTNGTASVNSTTGAITYTPATGFTGKDVLTYRVCDSENKCTTAQQEITVRPASSPNTTIAADDYYKTALNTPVSGNVKTNDSDPEGDTQTITAQTTPVAGKGILSLNTDGTFTFTPSNGFVGPVNFPYTTCDNGGPEVCASATLYIMVTDEPAKPHFNPDHNVTFVGDPVIGNLKTNDQNVVPGSTYGTPVAVPGNPSSCIPTMTPASSNTAGAYSFTCNTPGIFKFNVPVCEPSPSTTCTNVPLTITVLNKVLPESNGPVAITDIATTPRNTPVTLATLANDRPGNPETVLVPSSVTITSQPANGIAIVSSSTGDITYTPVTGFSGTDELTYRVCDNFVSPAKCTQAKQVITVNSPLSQNTTGAADDYVTTPKNTPVSGNVKTNDKDPEGQAQNVTPQTTVIPNVGSLILAADGSYTFTPLPTFAGPVNVPYTTCDTGLPSECASATLYITVTEDPLVPKYHPDHNVTFVNVAVPGVLSTNDIDVIPGTTYGTPVPVTGNPSTCVPAMNPVTGNTTGSYNFTCATPGVYRFNVPVCEPSPSTVCTNVPLVINVNEVANPSNNVPVAVADIAETPLNTAVTLATLSNDKSGNPATSLVPGSVTITNPPSHGTASVNATTGNITYTPSTGYVGKDVLTYRVCDNSTPTAKCTSAQQEITIMPADSPNSTLAADDYASTPKDTPVSGNVKTNDSDPEGNTQNVVAKTESSPGKGTLVLNTDGTYTFTPVSGYVGPVNFIYETCDTGTPQSCAKATLYLTVTDIPVCTPDLNPAITVLPNVGLQGQRNMTITVDIKEVAGCPTNGQIRFVVNKNTYFSFTWDPSATSIPAAGITGLENSHWTFSENALQYIWTYNNGDFNPLQISNIGFRGIWNGGASGGTANFSSIITNGSGGESNIVNNVDTDRVTWILQNP